MDMNLPPVSARVYVNIPEGNYQSTKMVILLVILP